MWVDRVTIKTDSLQQSLWFRVIEREKQISECNGWILESCKSRLTIEHYITHSGSSLRSKTLFASLSLSFSVDIMSAVERVKSAATPNSIIEGIIWETRFAVISISISV